MIAETEIKFVPARFCSRPVNLGEGAKATIKDTLNVGNLFIYCYGKPPTSHTTVRALQTCKTLKKFKDCIRATEVKLPPSPNICMYDTLFSILSQLRSTGCDCDFSYLNVVIWWKSHLSFSTFICNCATPATARTPNCVLANTYIQAYLVVVKCIRACHTYFQRSPQCVECGKIYLFSVSFNFSIAIHRILALCVSLSCL